VAALAAPVNHDDIYMSVCVQYCTVVLTFLNLRDVLPDFIFTRVRKLKEIEIYRDGMRSSGKFFFIKKTAAGDRAGLKEEDMMNSERHYLVFKF
jgi:hypothetical protein